MKGGQWGRGRIKGKGGKETVKLRGDSGGEGVEKGRDGRRWGKGGGTVGERE